MAFRGAARTAPALLPLFRGSDGESLPPNVVIGMSKKDTGTSSSFQAPLGTRDVLPDEWPPWRRLAQAARTQFERCGYQEIRTPVFEATGLFARSLGATTDIVQKEMYTFGEGDDAITLRPEGTAGVIRAYLERQLHRKKKFQKLYYIGPIFRKERPQAGRLRQFHQMGVEAIGSEDPLLDVETIWLACAVFDEAGLAGYRIKVNTMGCQECRPAYREMLRQAIEPRREELCKECQGRFERNVFRVLDCKNEGCQVICGDLPRTQDHVCDPCKSSFATVTRGLDELALPYEVVPRLVRGLDYYSRTVYEIAHSALGARDAICGGGRYDYLVTELGGPPTGAVGFAIGIEPTMLAMEKTVGPAGQSPCKLDAYIVAIGEPARDSAFALAMELRRGGVAVDVDYETRSPKAQMRSANRMQVSHTLILGDDELSQGAVKVKNMATSEEELVPRDAVLSRIAQAGMN